MIGAVEPKLECVKSRDCLNSMPGGDFEPQVEPLSHMVFTSRDFSLHSIAGGDVTLNKR